MGLIFPDISKVDGYQRVAEVLAGLMLSQLTCIADLRISRGISTARSGVPELDLEFVLCTEPAQPPGWRLGLRLSGVSGLRLADCGGSWPLRPASMAVDCMKDAQWEDVRWRVCNYENPDAGLDCYARDLTILCVDEAQQ